MNNIDDLPDELLRASFLELVKDEFYSRLDTKHGSDAAAMYPWVLSEVCKRWGRVCSENAELWSYISVGSGHKHEDHYWPSCNEETFDECNRCSYEIGPLLRTHRQLERSKNMALYIDAGRICDCRCEIIRFEITAEHSRRWKLLKIGLWRCHRDEGFLQDIISRDIDVSRLQEIILDHTNNYGNLLLSLFREKTLSSLRTATFLDLMNHNQDEEHLPSFPWAQLTTLNLLNHRGTGDDILVMLSRCSTSLIHLQLVTDQGPDARTPQITGTPDIVTLQHLISLDLSKNDKPEADFLLPYIRTPNLRALEFGRLNPISLNAFDNFITPLAGSLTSLSLFYPRGPRTYQEFSETGVAAYFQIIGKLEHLQHLSLHHPILRDAYYPQTWSRVPCNNFLTMATPQLEEGTSETTSHFLPRLAHLELHDLNFDEIMLKKMVQSRTKAVGRNSSYLASLKVLDISFDEEDVSTRYYQKIVSEFLKDVVEEGQLELKI